MSNDLVDEESKEISREKFYEVLRKKLHYLEGFVDALADTSYHVPLKRWIDGTRILLNRVNRKEDQPCQK